MVFVIILLSVGALWAAGSFFTWVNARLALLREVLDSMYEELVLAQMEDDTPFDVWELLERRIREMQAGT